MNYAERKDDKISEENKVKVLVEAYKEALEYDRHYDTLAWLSNSVFIPFSLGILVYTVSNLADLSILEVLILGIVSIIFIVMLSIISFQFGRHQDRITRPFIERIAEQLKEDIVLIPSKPKQRFIIRYIINYILPTIIFMIWICISIKKLN